MPDLKERMMMTTTTTTTTTTILVWFLSVTEPWLSLRDPPTSTSWVLRLKAGATKHSKNNFLKPNTLGFLLLLVSANPTSFFASQNRLRVATRLTLSSLAQCVPLPILSLLYQSLLAQFLQVLLPFCFLQSCTPKQRSVSFPSDSRGLKRVSWTFGDTKYN